MFMNIYYRLFFLTLYKILFVKKIIHCLQSPRMHTKAGESLAHQYYRKHLTADKLSFAVKKNYLAQRRLKKIKKLP